MKTYALNVLIAVDQLANTLFFGMPDETISARAWRLQSRFPWNYIRPVLDGLFFFHRSHCMESFMSEILRKHSPRKER